MDVMDLHRPLSTLLHSVEVDVLEDLFSARLSHTGAEIARRCNRSKSRVWSVLNALLAHGVVRRTVDEGGSWWSLNPDSPVVDALRNAAGLSDHIARLVTDELRTWAVLPVSGAITPRTWAAALGHESLVVVVHPEPDCSDVDRTRRFLRETLGTSVHLLVGTRSTVNCALELAGVDFWRDCHRARELVGRPLGLVLGGTGGI